MPQKEEEYATQLDLAKLTPLLKPAKFNKAALVPYAEQHLIVVLSKHRHYRNLVIELYSATVAKNGKLKNPIQLVDALDLVWKTKDQDELKFYAGISRFKNNYNENRFESDLEALKSIVNNPLRLPFYQHDETKAATINAGTLEPIKVHFLKTELELTVDERDGNFLIGGVIHLEQKTHALAALALRYHYFLQLKSKLYLITNPHLLNVIDFFKQHKNNLVIEQLAYENFQQQVLSLLEEKVKINYSYLRKATNAQLIAQGFDLENELLLYLSESEDFILLTPVIRYGGLEIPVISQKQIRAKDKRGKFFSVDRDEAKELQFISDIAKMHPYFEEQMAEFYEQQHTDCFYMHRKYFLEPDWFLEAFATWRNKGIAILGFNDLKNNKLSAYKATIDIKVISGIDWFETAIKVQFNQQHVSLKHLHKSIRNKNKFVLLDDGTTGILPAEWLAKFENYFGAGEVYGDILRTPNINYTAVTALYESELLDDTATNRIALYQAKFDKFHQIEEVEVPDTLVGNLRDYQKEGLNWLNFLDSFNFGGCLADDMGLGKTVQILAFILLQQQKLENNTNLIVVPASLVFNWQQEINKFAPSLKVKTWYGTERTKTKIDFSAYQIILTSYGTLVSDIKILRDYNFNYIFLDESQLIKNPASQRYKAARLLRSRNKIAITGTPIENNTYDLYGQLSFACPGLLGSQAQFKWLYAVPIDQFKDLRRADELQKRINPFILRRTKVQVAKELPDRTEMVIYCEMDKQQREIYESSRSEIRDYLMHTSTDELKKSSMHVLQGITKLRQICNSPALLPNEKYYGNSSSKMKVLMEQIESKAPYHKILVFSQFVGMLNLLQTELEQRNIKYAYLTGQSKNREKIVSGFQKNEDVRVFLISLKAGGVGLNLTQADYVFLIDPWWNPAVENQAIDRAHRIGQHQNVMAIRLICPDTIEEKIMVLQETKKDLVNNLIKTDFSGIKALSKQDLLNLI